MDIDVPIPDHILDDARAEADRTGATVGEVVAERFTWAWEGE